VKNGAMSIMASYSSWNGAKMHGNRSLLTGTLKEELGFQGFVVSDWQAVDQLDGTYEEQLANAINAGIDMVMVPDRYESFIESMKSNIESNKISMSRIDDAVRRILKTKMMMGLFDRPYANRKLLSDVGSPAHREVAREAVRKSVVLLKNEKNVLPIKPVTKTIYVVGKKSDDIGSQCGGWSMSWQGETGKITEGTTIYEAIRKGAPEGTTIIYNETGKGMKNADNTLCVLVIGEKPYAEYKGDSSTLTLSSDDMVLAKRCHESGIPTVTILLSGRPVILDGLLDTSNALLAAWLPGTEGEGVADILFGKYAPTGKLSMSWPRSVKQVPVNVGDVTYDPLFPFGFGLTYKK
ncbi:MAG TPA: glycoside hydrolase family 3 C-terminal domain-containing protein, partial [Spirochaetota bacterium]